MTREALHSYARHLHALGPLLQLVQVMLATVFLLHIITGILLFLGNRAAAGPVAARRRDWQSAGISRTMISSGLVLLAFLVMHLGHFVVSGGDVPLADRVAGVLGRPLPGLLYLAAFAVLGLHLVHGLWSMGHSFGASLVNSDALLRGCGRGGALFIAAVFIALGVLLLCQPGYLS